MTIYVLKINCDYDNSYHGLDDIELECFTTYEKAQEKFEEVLELIKYNFIADGNKEDELCITFKSDREFNIDNGKDYFSARIEKHQVI